jgi:hypothetical protein
MLEKRFLVSRVSDGAREFVLNGDGEDVCV